MAPREGRDVASKTVSDLAKLSANLTAFDLPVHEGGPVPAPARKKPARAHEQSAKTAQSASNARTGLTEPVPLHSATSANLSTIIGAAGSIDGPAPTNSGAWARARDVPAPIGGGAKRALDIVVASATLVLLSPLLLIVALAVYLTMGRPIVFPQSRMGFAGRTFSCPKFRTMVTDAEAALQQYLKDHPEAAHEWRTRQKLQHDPRITPLGHILRRSSIDELPQLFSVLAGHMSCVGPRPIVRSEIERYGPHYRDYTMVRPGITGLWQVSGRSRVSYRRRIALDRYYVRRWSFWLDIWILIRTIPAVLRPGDTA